MLHLTRVAFGCDSYESLVRRIADRKEGGELRLTTRYRPKRHEELIGGSLYWILKHRLLGRCEIRGFEEAEGGRTSIVLEPNMIPVEPLARRAHQGWRYLVDEDAPSDLEAFITAGGEALPRNLTEKLAEIGLF